MLLVHRLQNLRGGRKEALIVSVKEYGKPRGAPKGFTAMHVSVENHEMAEDSHMNFAMHLHVTWYSTERRARDMLDYQLPT